MPKADAAILAKQNKKLQNFYSANILEKNQAQWRS